ncbi:tripartite motif-containing protein 3-like [Ptychodera flava]|uniref:tripartite motif-containing protein 3-like n=1 Tax=Ptychodera flava TaxID=63121 RepID=UPI00396A4B1F
MAKITRAHSQKITSQIREEYLSCTICLQRYTAPKILPCHHTFCSGCLTTCVGKETEVICPTCYTPCPLSADGVKHLKSSFFISSLIDIVCQGTPDRCEVPGVCEGCEENVASHRCLDCSLDFCQSCTKPHKIVPATRNHRILTYNEYNKASLSDVRLDSRVYCKYHPEREIKFYCDTCQVPVCLECTVVEHRVPRCSHRNLQDAAEDYAKKLREMLTKVREKEEKCEASKGMAGDNMDKLRKYCREEEERIRRTSDEMIRMIKREQQRLVEELKTDYATKLKQAEVQVHDLEFTRGNISSVCSHIETVIQHGSALQLLTSQEEMVNRIEKLATAKTTEVKPPDIVRFKAMCDIREHDILGMLQSKVSVQNCSVENIPKQIFTGGSFDIIIKTRDGTGKLVIPYEEVTAKLAIREGSWEDLRVWDNRDGTHRATVRGRVEGTYRVTVAIAGQLVPGAPFGISVKKGFVRNIGTKGKDKSQFSSPMGIATNRQGDLVTCDTTNSRVQIIDTDGNCKSAFTVTDFENLFNPCGIAISTEDEYFMTDLGNIQVIVSDDKGQLCRSFGQAELKYPHGIAISPLDDTVYVTDWDGKIAGTDKENSHCVRKFTQDGRHIRSFGKYGTKHGHFRGPAYLAVNHQGMVFVSDFYNCRIWVISPDCVFLCSIGSCGKDGGRLCGPSGVVVDSNGYIYIAEVTNQRVQKFTSNGLFVSRIDIDEDGLCRPHGITLTNDVPCRVAVVDHENDCIKVFAQ